MCGIAGFVNAPGENEQTLKKITDVLAHRGPDDSGYFLDTEKGVGLGSRRLAIVDLSPNGRMPMSDDSGQVFLVQNGEIYNYLEIKGELENKGHRFKSTGDSEVILKGYLEWGENVFSKLRGMFAIAIYDKSRQVSYLVRDRIGIKPLYYLERGRAFYFASEVKSFFSLTNDLFSRSLNLDRLKILMGFMFLPLSHQTLFDDVKKVLPAHYLKITEEKTENICYWKLREPRPFYDGTFDQAVDDLDNLLSQTVKSHLMSDVPLGVMLSGGLDSSLIAALVKKHSNSSVLTFTAKFDHPFNESEKALRVARHLQTNHQEILIDPQEINQNIESIAYDLDDLTTFDGGLLTTKILCREIKKKGVTVLLLGEGSDEIFGGYSWFGLSQNPYRLLPGALRAFAYYYAISRNLTFNPLFYYQFWQRLYGRLKDKDIFRTISNLELLIQLPNHLLMKVDKGSMAASVEARVPYLDHKLVEFAYSLPAGFKLKGDWFSGKSLNEKYILREVAKRYLPPEFLAEKKRGFMLPLKEVLQANLPKVKDYTFSSQALIGQVLPRQTLESLFQPSNFAFLNTQKEYLLWRIFLFEVWHQNLVKNAEVRKW